MISNAQCSAPTPNSDGTYTLRYYLLLLASDDRFAFIAHFNIPPYSQVCSAPTRAIALDLVRFIAVCFMPCHHFFFFSKKLNTM